MTRSSAPLSRFTFILVSFALVAPITQGVSTLQAAELPTLKISPNQRYLVTADGKPFFWLGDTAWELFHRLSREDADRYLIDRALKGFTVIQAVAIAELDGHTVPNVAGHLPLVNLDPSKPAIKDGPKNDYWDDVDAIIESANAKGMYVGFLPTWGRFWHDPKDTEKPLFTPENAAIYGEWLGKRYQNKGIVWILGGDRSIDNDVQRQINVAMAKGIRKGDGGRNLITWHPPGGAGSSKWFPNEPWLDFHMRQNGHVAEYTGRYSQTRSDYDLTPIKPVIDGEPIYEDHPVSFNGDNLGYSIAADVRRALYWDLFSGACGHTYGHHSVWQMFNPVRAPINRPLMTWEEALNQPGAAQMQFGRRLIESRPILARIPDDSVIVDAPVKFAIPGAGTRRLVATRDSAGSYAMVYVPIGRPFAVRMDKITGASVKAWWYNPRSGKSTPIGVFPNTGERTFVTPTPGELTDWVLVLDDASKRFPTPGTRAKP